MLRSLSTTGKILGAAILLFAAPLCVAQASPNLDSHVKTGTAMPPVVVKRTDGTTFSLTEERGKVVLVNFWATWCGPCLLEMPKLQAEIWQRYKDNPKFAMIAIAREQDVATVEAFHARHKSFTFPLAVDPKRSTYSLFADAGIPRTYLVGPDGKVLFQSVGDSPADLRKLEKDLDAALSR